MSRLSHPAVGLCILAALLSGLTLWEHLAGGLSESSLSELAFPGLARAQERRRQLEADTVVERARRRHIDELIEDMAEGRRSLLDGASRMRELYRDQPRIVWERIRMRFPDMSDDERFCRLLIGEVESFLRGEEPARARSVVARLEHELEEHRRAGTLRLEG
jgi:hypothetical protein